ncbi:sensor histidine kinase [Halosegnis sp.]|uniref:sensor histidine kinase n=1 Tax=Halosegnis sp. TaxID=2864959 RepID=UPI0035D402BC
METLIDDLLALLKAGNTIDDPEAVALGDQVELAWGSVQTAEATLQATVDTTIRADASRLRQLLENLFRNAIEHGGADVTVTVEAIDRGFAVADDGLGIPPEDCETVFESGYSSTNDGTGFGLAIVADIVDAHGWRIRVTESNADGARFEITGIEPA